MPRIAGRSTCPERQGTIDVSKSVSLFLVVDRPVLIGSRLQHVDSVLPDSTSARTGSAEAPETFTVSETVSDLFPPDAWQCGTCKRLQTNDGVLLFEHFEQVEEDKWRLWPITVVVGRGMSEQQDTDPVIITALNGAEIRFTESLDMLSGGAPPIKRGEMIGAVEIRRPSSSPKTQPMLITTKNVGIDNSKIWNNRNDSHEGR